MNFNYHLHSIEYLEAPIDDDGITGREVIVLTLRPDDWRPHNTGITRPQGDRPQFGLRRLLAAMLLIFILLLAGCSTQVEVSSVRPVPSHPAAVEKSSTKVAVDLLSRRQEDSPPRPQPPAPTEVKQPEVEVVGAANSETLPGVDQPTSRGLVEVTGNQNVVINVAGDLHIEQHYHTTLKVERPRQSNSVHKPVKIEIQSPNIDPRCQRLLEEHDRRVGDWKRLFPSLD